MQVQEATPAQESARRPKKPASKSFEYLDVLEAIKSGDKKHAGLERFRQAAVKMNPEQLRPLALHLVQHERCSTEFADRFLSDAAFQKRVIELCANFSANGERMAIMEETEIYTQLMEPGSDDIGLLMKTTNPAERFKQLEPLESEDVMKNRLWDLKNQLATLVKPGQEDLVQDAFRKGFEQAGIQYTGTDGDWLALFAAEDRLEHFLAVSEVKSIYQMLSKGKRVESLGRSVQLYWRTSEDGTKIPSMHVQQMAVNPETDYVSELGFTIEKQPGEQAGESRRVMKDVAVVVDKDSRNKNEGAEFLLGNLKLIKEYKLEDAEFVANIKVGSYVWARISDVDVPSMAEKLPMRVKSELGPRPWDAKKARALVFREEILPLFEKNLAAAIYSIIDSIKDSKERAAMQNVLVDDLLNKQYEALRHKALAGELSMEELVNLGKGLDVVRFNDEGEVVRPDDPEAKHYGHLGKAAIMGVPWNARLGLDTRSLFNVVDRLSKGSGFVSYLKKSGKKIGLALSL